MMHNHQHVDVETLSAYADGELDAADVAGVERHLSQCGDCREQLRRMRDLVSAAHALPREMAPPVAVWTQLRHRVARGKTTPIRRLARVGGWLAAAAVLLVAGTMLLKPGRLDKRHAVVDTPDAISVALIAVDRNYVGTVAELRGTLEAQRATLAPSTIRVVERSLAVIDTAIAEARAALASDPANQALVEILSAQYERKVDLLQRATKLSPSL